jgi:threonine/homoserine efflux transporter RhtA
MESINILDSEALTVGITVAVVSYAIPYLISYGAKKVFQFF